MNLRQLSETLGIGERTLRRYRRDHPDQVPGSNDLAAWREFVTGIRNYSVDRTRPRDRNGKAESPAEHGNGEYTALEERKQRILRLRLANQSRRTALEQLRGATVPLAECVSTLNRIKARTADELLKLPSNLCHQLEHRGPEQIQKVLDAEFREVLAKLSRPETFRD